MGSFKMLAVAVLMTAGWLGLSAVCCSALARTPRAMTTVLSHGRGAPVERVPVAPSMSVAQREAGKGTAAVR